MAMQDALVAHHQRLHLAPGAAPAGGASDEFTWFPGYSWRIALCRDCGRHMGWQFLGDDDFFGLIKTHLTGINAGKNAG